MSYWDACSQYWMFNWCDDWCPVWQKWECEVWADLSYQSSRSTMDIEQFYKIKEKYYNTNNNNTMINNLDLQVLKDKFKFDITKLPKIESDVSFEALQKVLAKSSDFSWATDLDWDIIFMVTADNYESFEILLDAGLLDQECILLKDNVKNQYRLIQVKLSSIDWWEKHDPLTQRTYKEQNLYLYSDDDMFHWHVPDNDTKGKKFWYFLWEVHNTNWFYSLTLLFRVWMKWTAVKRTRVKTPKIKWVYVDPEKFKIVQACYEIKKPCLFMWPTGSGKTTIVKELAKQKKQKLTRINLNWEITKEDLVWSKTLEAGTVVWKDWPLTQALRDWDIILLDEINAALPEVLLLIQSLTEAHDWKLGELRLNENNWEVLVPHENCRIYWTGNPSDEYIWTKDFNPATLSRWIVLYIDYLEPNEDKELLMWKYSKKLWTKIWIIWSLVNFANKLRKEKYEDNLIYSCSTRDIEQLIELYILWIKLWACIDTCIMNKAQNSDDKDVIKRVINREFDSKDLNSPITK